MTRLRIQTGMCALVALIAMTGAARAEVHKNPVGQVQIDIPDTWKVTKKPGGLLIGQSKDNAVGLLFWVVNTPEDAKTRLKELDKALEGKVTDIKWPNAPQPADVNGMKGIRNKGTALVGGKNALVMVAILGPTPTKRGVLVFGAMEQSKATEHKAELQNIFASLKKMSADGAPAATAQRTLFEKEARP